MASDGKGGDDIVRLDATDALREITAGRLTSREWLSACLARIEACEPDVRAFASLDAAAFDVLAAHEARGIGACVPIGVKDIIDVRGLPTGLGLGKAVRTSAAPPPLREGGSMALLREAGCVVVGKTVTTELGHRHPGPTRNPRALAHTPGGSSSGSAAAVAAGMVPVALGTQTSGSVIRPAAYCGVVGYKPTYGDFDTSGMLANAPSLDTLGLFARSVDDVALLRSWLLETPLRPLEQRPLAGLRVAVVDAPRGEADDETLDKLDDLARQLAHAGGRVVSLRLDTVVRRLLELHGTLSGFEFRRSIADERCHALDELSAVLREGRLADGQRTTSADYRRAQREAEHLRRVLRERMRRVDFLLCPSAPGPAPAGLGSTGAATFNSAWTLARTPAITLPLFRAADSGLPIGCQLVGHEGGDDHLLAQAKAVMQSVVGTPACALRR